MQGTGIVRIRELIRLLTEVKREAPCLPGRFPVHSDAEQIIHAQAQVLRSNVLHQQAVARGDPWRGQRQRPDGSHRDDDGRRLRLRSHGGFRSRLRFRHRRRDGLGSRQGFGRRLGRRFRLWQRVGARHDQPVVPLAATRDLHTDGHRAANGQADDAVAVLSDQDPLNEGMTGVERARLAEPDRRRSLEAGKLGENDVTFGCVKPPVRVRSEVGNRHQAALWIEGGRPHPRPLALASRIVCPRDLSLGTRQGARRRAGRSERDAHDPAPALGRHGRLQQWECTASNRQAHDSRAVLGEENPSDGRVAWAQGLSSALMSGSGELQIGQSLRLPDESPSRRISLSPNLQRSRRRIEAEAIERGLTGISGDGCDHSQADGYKNGKTKRHQGATPEGKHVQGVKGESILQT
ncbi:hypothetical protein D3C87_1145190 [compost metagenome]